jgi:hypothetical protein
MSLEEAIAIFTQCGEFDVFMDDPTTQDRSAPGIEGSTKELPEEGLFCVFGEVEGEGGCPSPGEGRPSSRKDCRT